MPGRGGVRAHVTDLHRGRHRIVAVPVGDGEVRLSSHPWFPWQLGLSVPLVSPEPSTVYGSSCKLAELEKPCRRRVLRR